MSAFPREYRPHAHRYPWQQGVALLHARWHLTTSITAIGSGLLSEPALSGRSQGKVPMTTSIILVPMFSVAQGQAEVFPTTER